MALFFVHTMVSNIKHQTLFCQYLMCKMRASHGIINNLIKFYCSTRDNAFQMDKCMQLKHFDLVWKKKVGYTLSQAYFVTSILANITLIVMCPCGVDLSVKMKIFASTDQTF